jgi:hypothetical protein
MARSMPMVPKLDKFETGLAPPDSVALRLFDDGGEIHTVSISRGQITPLILELTRRASQLPQAQGRAFETLPLTTVGADPAVGPDGRLGISIRLAGGLRLTLALTDEVIAGLQSVLTTLSQMAKPPAASSH